MTGIRRRIRIPRQQPIYIQSRDAIKNILEYALRQHGYRRVDDRPLRWGFGVVAHRVPGRQHFYQVDQVIFGSSDPAIMDAMAAITPQDLREPNAVPGAGLDLTYATLTTEAPWVPTPAAHFLALSPIRVLQGHRQTILTLGPDFTTYLNRTMAHRFGRPFHLTFQPDSFYVRRHNGQIAARMAIKMSPEGSPIVYPGLVLPFVLTGPEDDIATAWYSGLGSSTGMGFGCLDLAH